MSNSELLEIIAPTKEQKIAQAVVGLTTLAVFVSAVRSGIKGDYAAGTFKAVIWVGLCANVRGSMANKIALRQK